MSQLKGRPDVLTRALGPRLTVLGENWPGEPLDRGAMSRRRAFPSELEDWTIANRGRAAGEAAAHVPTEPTLTLDSAGMVYQNDARGGDRLLALRLKNLRTWSNTRQTKGAIILFGRLRRMEAPEFPLATPGQEHDFP